MPSPQMYSVEPTLVRPSEQSEAFTEERKRYWEDYARSAAKWIRLRSYYQSRLAEIYKLSIPPGMRVLELGCGDGSLLAKLDPASVTVSISRRG